MAKTKRSSLRSVGKADNEPALASWEDRTKVVEHVTYQLESVLDGICEIARKTTDIPAQGRLLALAMRAADLNGAAVVAVCDNDLERDALIELWRTLNTDDFDTGTEAANG